MTQLFTNDNISEEIKNNIFEKLIKSDNINALTILFNNYNYLNIKQKKQLTNIIDNNNSAILFSCYIRKKNIFDQQIVHKMFFNLRPRFIENQLLNNKIQLTEKEINYVWENLMTHNIANFNYYIKHKLPITTQTLNMFQNSNYYDQEEKQRWFQEAIFGYIPALSKQNIDLIIKFCEDNKLYENILTKIKKSI